MRCAPADKRTESNSVNPNPSLSALGIPSHTPLPPMRPAAPAPPPPPPEPSFLDIAFAQTCVGKPIETIADLTAQYRTQLIDHDRREVMSIVEGYRAIAVGLKADVERLKTQLRPGWR